MKHATSRGRRNHATSALSCRDGVLLCHVANALDAAAVDMKKVNQRPQMAQFLCLKNIRSEEPPHEFRH